ncbi:MAG: FAD-binding oxidoreductase [Janthinobacterium lividum]
MLTAALPGTASVGTGPDVLAAHAVDRSGARADGLPVAVVWATEVADVVAAVRFAARHRLALVPRGAGSGLSGGATAGRGSLVLDLSRMDRILALQPEDGLAEVEPGVVTADLDRAARAVGLRYAPDPASWDISTLGGNIATNAGGLRCVKYGVTGDAVVALTVVLADGSVVHTGHRTVKGVTGYDLTRLFVGSEGTLGVVVGATLRLSAIPVRTATASAFFPSAEAAAETCLELTAAGIRPSTLELLDEATLQAVDRAQGTSLAGRGRAFLLIQTDGFGAQQEMEAALSVVARRASHAELAEDEAVAEQLVATRRLALPSIERLGRVRIEDVAVPRTRLAEAVAGIAEVARATGVSIFTFAHAGDGNLHPILAVDSAAPERLHEAEAAIARLALRLGGTLTGEHGVGLLKRAWVDEEIDPASLALHQRVKDALDPAHVLNPAKAHLDLSPPPEADETDGPDETDETDETDGPNGPNDRHDQHEHPRGASPRNRQRSHA